MRKNWRNNIFVLLWLMIAISACNNHNHEQADTYTCPMHPTVISDKPGSCPVCGMDLVRKAREGEEVAITEDLARLIKSPNEVVASSIKTTKPEYKAMEGSVEALGIITYDTRNVYTISARIGGRLEKVYLKYSFQRVSKGQKVADIYSPEVVAAQRELLFLLERDAENNELIEGAKNKLLLLGFSSTQIEDLLKRKEPAMTFSIYSPYDGYVIREDQPAPAIAAGSSASGMNAMGNSVTGVVNSDNSAELIRAGNYVSVGQTIFRIVDTSSLFVELNLPLSSAGGVKVNGEISMDLGGVQQKAKIDFIQPYFERGEEFLKLRVYRRNDKSIRIGQLVKATIPVHSPEMLWVPKEAIVDLGLDHIVFVKDREVFRARKVEVNARVDGSFGIKSGLASSDEIAVNAQYLVDSESFIKSK